MAARKRNTTKKTTPKKDVAKNPAITIIEEIPMGMVEKNLFED